MLGGWILENGVFVKGSWGFTVGFWVLTVRAWLWLFGLGLGTAFWGLKAVVAVLQQHTERRVGWSFGQSPEWILAQRFMLAFDHQPTHFVRRLVAGRWRDFVAVLQQQTGRWGVGLIAAIDFVDIIVCETWVRWSPARSESCY